MSHIGNLFNKAVHNNTIGKYTIGKYTITPQHGKNLYQYFISKDFKTPNRIVNNHIFTITIDKYIKEINIISGNIYYTTYKKDYQNILNEIEKIYYQSFWKINFIQ